MEDLGSVGKWANRVLIGLCLFGLALFVYGSTIPVYTDYETARQLKINACNQNGVMVAGWFERMAALETMRHPFMQGGISLVLVAVIWKALLKCFPGNLPWLPRTPFRKVTFFGLGVGLLIASWIAQLFSLDLDFRRGEFPWCADSIAIPVAGLTSLFLVLTLGCLVLGGVLVMGFGKLPAELNQWDRQRPLRSWVISLVLAAVFIAVGALTVFSGVESAFLSVPAGVVALFLIAATRAALLSPK